MKQRLWSLALALALAAALLCGCGASAGSPAGEAAPQAMMDTASGAQAEFGGDVNAPSSAAVQRKNGSAKLIYTAGMELETTTFDDAAQGLAALTETCGGYFESSTIQNIGSGYRVGTYAVRVPAEQYAGFCRKVGEQCHVTWQTASTEDVSEQYYDTDGRLRTQQTKLERLQTLLAKAEKMEDIITIENAISQTEEQIDQLSGQLQHYDALVEYSTVNLTLTEVSKLSNVEEPVSGFPSRVGAAFVSGWKNFVSGLESLTVALAYGWVWVLVLAAVAAAVIRVVRRRRARDAAVLPAQPVRPEKERGKEE